MAVGILAVQGAFREHGDCLDKLGAEYRFIRNRSDIDDSIDRLILPGGESTVQRKLLNELDLFEPLKKLIESDVPVMGTCAGLILLAQTITNGDESVFGTLPLKYAETHTDDSSAVSQHREISVKCRISA